MAKLAPDVGGADFIADTLNPGFKWDPRQLTVATPCNTVPDGHADVLHDVINVAGSPDACQAGNDVAVHAINRNHYLVDRDQAFSWRRSASQRDIHLNGGPRRLARLIGLGFDFHGFTALTVQVEYVAESREAPLQGWMQRSN
jgi:hypothetical protein